MTETTSILPFHQGDEIDDPLTALAREGARRVLAEALAAEADAFVAAFAEMRLEDGRRRVVRHGAGPERVIQTGVGPVPVRRPKVRDRDPGAGEPARFTSAILPRWARRTRSLDALLPVLYLRGVSTGDFREALGALLVREAPNLSPSVIGRLRETWQDGYGHWQARDLSAHSSRLRLGRRRLPAGPDGARGRVHAGRHRRHPRGQQGARGLPDRRARERPELARVLVDLKARGLAAAPEIAVGDGAMGFWRALDEVFPGTRHQRCWVHKVANVPGKVPRSVQPGMKAMLREVRDAPDRETAHAAVAVFAEKYEAKHAKAVACLTRDREALSNPPRGAAVRRLERGLRRRSSSRAGARRAASGACRRCGPARRRARPGGRRRSASRLR